MADKTKTCLSVLFFASMFILPLVALAIGWVGWDFRTGAIVALITFAVFFLLAGILLATVKDLSWVAVSLPFLFGFIYSVLPDLLPGPVDDAVVFAAGALLTFALWLRKQPETPKWIVFPLLASSLYTLVSGLIPGPVDDLLVAAIGAGVAIYGASRQLKTRSESQPKEDDAVEGEFRVQE